MLWQRVHRLHVRIAVVLPGEPAVAALPSVQIAAVVPSGELLEGHIAAVVPSEVLLVGPVAEAERIVPVQELHAGEAVESLHQRQMDPVPSGMWSRKDSVPCVAQEIQSHIPEDLVEALKVRDILVLLRKLLTKEPELELLQPVDD